MRRLSTSNRAFASRFVVSGGLLLLAAGVVAASLIALRPFDPVRAEVVQDGLEHPWDIAFAPDGRMLVTERAGRVLVFDSDASDAALLHTATVPDVRAELESGLMGIAIAADTVFVCASRHPDRATWRVEILRSTLADNGALAPFEVVPVVAEAVGGPRHQSCAVEVALDHLWVSIGDANLPAGENRALDPGSLNGKILRLAPDGSVPDDNPSAPPSTASDIAIPRASPSRRMDSSTRPSTGPMSTTSSTSSPPAATMATRATRAPPTPDRSRTAAARLSTTSRPPGPQALRRSRRPAQRS